MRSLIFFITILTIGACQQISEEERMSAGEKLSMQLGNATLWFQQSAEMEALYLQAYERGKMLLKIKMDTISDTELGPAVVLDLDETVLDNSPFEANLFLNGNNYSSEAWKTWCEKASAKALPGAIDFLNFADSIGLKIFYISNRKIDLFEPTLKNLKALKLPQAEKEHLLLRTTKSDKTTRREKVKADHQILLFVGDNLTDYKEVFAQRDSTLAKDLVKKYQKELLHNFIMLPNPMYGEWESAIYENDFSKSAEEKLKLRNNALKNYN